MVNAAPGKWSSFDPLPIIGTVTFGTSAVVIPNILANDGINGVAATAGSGGNIILTAKGAWPAGITLNTNTGSVSVSSTVPLGSYALRYQMCDRQSPLACVDATATINVQAPIVQPGGSTRATPVPVIDGKALQFLTAMICVFFLTAGARNTKQ